MGSEMKSPLTVQGLCKEYPAFKLQDVSFSLVPGTITGFIGRNGAGKTTTINSVLSFVHPDAGEITFFGMPWEDHDREIKEKIGFVSAGMTYYTRKKLKAITAVTKTFYPAWDDEAYRQYMSAFGLDEEKTPAELSNGMKIKYALALALSHGAELLILEKCADRILFLQQGVLKADDDLDSFRNTWRIAECAGEIPETVRTAARGICRTRDGYTVLLRNEDAAGTETREASLEEIMIHLEKEAEKE